MWPLRAAGLNPAGPEKKSLNSSLTRPHRKTDARTTVTVSLDRSAADSLTLHGTSPPCAEFAWWTGTTITNLVLARSVLPPVRVVRERSSVLICRFRANLNRGKSVKADQQRRSAVTGALGNSVILL